MPSRRNQIRMDDSEIWKFIESRKSLQVATLSKDGSPHLTTLWFGILDGDIAFETFTKSQKVVNLRRDPRLTVMVESGAKYEELKGVTIYGRARIIEDLDEVFAFGDRIYERYWGPIDSDLIREGVRAMGRKRVLIVVEPEKTVSWDHSKLGGTY